MSFESSRFLVIVSEFNELVTRALLSGAERAFEAQGIPSEQRDVLWVPGSFELPVAAARAADTGRYSAIVCLGCVIRGETAHFDYISGQAAAGLMKVSIDKRIPIAFGVLTTDTADQALARSGLKSGNKGAEAVLTILDVLRSFQRLEI